MASTIGLLNFQPDTTDLSHEWPYIKAGVDQLMNSPENISPTGHMNVWVAIHNVSAKSKAWAIDIQDKLKEMFVEQVQPIAKGATGMHGVGLLQYYATEFRRYKTGSERVDRAFAYYNRRWAGKDGGGTDVLLPVYSLALTQWQQKCAMIIQADGAKITNAILDLITKERNGEKIEEDIVKDVIQSLDSLTNESGLYREFEDRFIEATTNHYQKEFGRVFQSENFVRDYLNTFEERLLDEERRADRYLLQKTHNKVTEVMLISEHCEGLAQKLRETGEDKKLDEMYALLSRVKPQGLGPLEKSFEKIVEPMPEPVVSPSSWDTYVEDTSVTNNNSWQNPFSIQVSYEHDQDQQGEDVCFSIPAAPIIKKKKRK